MCNLLLHVAFLMFGILSLIAPLAPVTFWHVIVADYLTSLAKAMSDFQLTFCISAHIFRHDRSMRGTGYVRSTQLWDDYHEHCADTVTNALMLALPFWLRLMQCLKVYSVTREQKNLWNALKYSTAFPLVYAGYLRRHSPGEWHDHFFIACAVVQSTYTFIWDVLMDWGLPQRCNAAKGDARPRLCGYTLREPLLVTRSKGVYFLLCAFNLTLRFAWTLSVFGRVPGRGVGMFFFEVIEILRRTVWAVFRIEWEVITKVHNSSQEAKLLTSGDSEGSEEMKDIED